MQFNEPIAFDSSSVLFDQAGTALITSPSAQASSVSVLPAVSGGGSISFISGSASAAAVAVVPVPDVGQSFEEFPPSDWPEPGTMHFRLEDPVLGRLELSCENGYIVSSYDFSSPAVREVVYNNSFDDGTFDYTRFIGSRAVTLDIVIRPTQNIDGTGAQFSEPQMRDALLAYAHPGRRPRLTFSEHGDDRVKQVDLRAADFSAAVSKPRFNAMSVSWVAPRGLFESSWEQCSTQYIGETAGIKEFAVYNRGNVNAHWTAVIDGEILQPIIYIDGDLTNALELEFNMTVGDTVTINSLDRSVKINGERTGYRYLSDNSTWFSIPPGNHTLSVSSSNSTRLGYPFAKWENDGIAPLATWGGDPPHLAPTDPSVPPPWAWSSATDPTTNQPGVTSITLCYRSTWI